MTIAGAAWTNIGKVRHANEDCLVAGSWCQQHSMSEPKVVSINHGELPLCLIADGMGGYNGGEQASQFVCRALQERISLDTDVDRVSELLRSVNREVFAIAERQQDLIGMGTTVAGMLFKPDEILWFNVGDSKIFRYRNDFLRQISIDDVPLGSSGSTGSHSVTQALGGAARFMEVAPHLGTEPRTPGWRYLMCSDGLTDVLSVEAMEAAMAYSDMEAISRMMLEALTVGAPDNVSIVVITVGDNSASQRDGTRND